jgi:hypothetical protein
VGTSVLGRLSDPLCDAVLEAEGSAGILGGLERSNLFLVPLDQRRQWYRYHHLFAELVRLELASRGPGLVATLHRRAAAWRRQAGTSTRPSTTPAPPDSTPRPQRSSRGTGSPTGAAGRRALRLAGPKPAPFWWMAQSALGHALYLSGRAGAGAGRDREHGRATGIRAVAAGAGAPGSR